MSRRPQILYGMSQMHQLSYYAINIVTYYAILGLIAFSKTVYTYLPLHFSSGVQDILAPMA